MLMFRATYGEGKREVGLSFPMREWVTHPVRAFTALRRCKKYYRMICKLETKEEFDDFMGRLMRDIEQDNGVSLVGVEVTDPKTGEVTRY